MSDDTISRQAAIAEFSCCELTPDGGIDVNYAIDFLKQMPSAQPEPLTLRVDSELTKEEYDKLMQDIKDAPVVLLPYEQPDTDEWCHDCKEYDTENDCCPRWGQVIKTALEDAQPERWIPCSERLPEDLEEVNVTWVNHIPEPYYDFLKDNPFTGSAVYYRGEWFWYSSRCVDMLAEYGVNGMDKVDDGIEITAWMPLPEPYKGEQDG